MTAYKLGHDLLRGTALLRSGGLLWQGCSFPGLGGTVSAHSGQRYAGHSCLSSTAQKRRPSVSYHVYAVRFHSQEGTSWQGLSDSGGQHHSPENPTNAMDLPKESMSQTLFNERLKECSSPTDVLDLVGQYKMKLSQVSSSLMCIWKSMKKMSEEQARYERKLMLNHPTFKLLCSYALRNATAMRRSDLGFCLFAAVKLGLPQKSRLVQTLLRAIQETLDEFDDKALSVLATSLGDMDSSENVNALRKGIGLMMEHRVSGMKSVVSLQKLMRCIGKDAPQGLKLQLEERALSMVDQFTLPNTQYMVITLAAMDFSSKPLLEVCCRKLAENVHVIPTDRILNVLRACWVLRYSNLHFFSTVAEHLTSTFDMWNNKQLIIFLLIFMDLGFRPVSLLDMFFGRVMQDPNSLSLKDVLGILKVCSQLNHFPENQKQEFLDSIVSVLESYLPTMSPSELLSGVFSLCLLGQFPLAPLERLLRKETLDEVKGSTRDRRMLHLVNLCLRLDRPSLPEGLAVPPGGDGTLLIDRTVTQDWKTLIQKIAEDAVLQEGVVLEEAYFIDCLITLPLQRTDLSTLSEGEGLSSPSEGEGLSSPSAGEGLCSPSAGEGLSPESCQRLAVLSAPPSQFCLGTSHPRGMLVLITRHLRALGYGLVLVPQEEFASLSEPEMVERLRTRIFPVKGAAAV
ncbi:hypothetical protein COCON_G00042950 [Conger conger]|uniref:RAP domain-containing protein n=1 Tax=Conger conger TaxID=82655 RepID=A0A9Q1I4R4_CONCO|nr:FAST kinase domain-containing protein 2, mitochondrial [Conger conger]XP_061089831.1 FAST kinase domain-containing protein 2, mitochondrial [Conger conger]KAJ8281776.1 hypothetical protein COCON_G00042950 [Conger conger]